MREVSFSEVHQVSGGYIPLPGIIGSINGYKGNGFCKNIAINGLIGIAMGSVAAVPVSLATASVDGGAAVVVGGSALLIAATYTIAEGTVGYCLGSVVGCATK